MSEQVPTITDTSVRQPVDSEAVSSTTDITGRFIEGPHVYAHAGIRMRRGYDTSRCGLLFQNARAERIVVAASVAPWRCARHVLISLE